MNNNNEEKNFQDRIDNYNPKTKNNDGVIYIRKPNGVNFTAFKENIGKSFILAFSLDPSEVKYEHYSSNFAVNYCLENGDAALDIYGVTFKLSIGTQSYDVTPSMKPPVRDELQVNIGDIPTEMCNESDFRDMCEDFCRCTSISASLKGDIPEVFVDCELDTNTFGNANTGKLWVNYIPDRIYRQGGKKGWFYDEKPNFCIRGESPTWFIANGTTYCKCCGKTGHPTNLCYIIATKLCDIADISTPLARKKWMIRASTLVLKNGDIILMTPGKSVVRKMNIATLGTSILDDKLTDDELVKVVSTATNSSPHSEKTFTLDGTFKVNEIPNFNDLIEGVESGKYLTPKKLVLDKDKEEDNISKGFTFLNDGVASPYKPPKTKSPINNSVNTTTTTTTINNSVEGDDSSDVNTEMSPKFDSTIPNTNEVFFNSFIPEIWEQIFKQSNSTPIKKWILKEISGNTSLLAKVESLYKKAINFRSTPRVNILINLVLDMINSKEIIISIRK